MLARLSFTTSTVIKPEILIIDEILGAGDAYFLSKSKDRMRKLIDSGASILLVSHSLEQITQFCTTSIWIERGKLVRFGPTLEVVKEYQQSVRICSEQRLKAMNYKRQMSRGASERFERYGETLVIRYVVEGKQGARCDISEVSLMKDSETEECLKVGDVQDSSGSHQAYVQLEGGEWSRPQKKGRHHRYLYTPGTSVSWAAGNVVFSLYTLYDDSDYKLETHYSFEGSGRFYVEIWQNGTLKAQMDLPEYD